jgi:hypothetical protein
MTSRKADETVTWGRYALSNIRRARELSDAGAGREIRLSDDWCSDRSVETKLRSEL